MSKLGNFNFYVLQWFFIRLSRKGKMIDGKFIQNTKKRWKIIFRIPLTGWENK